MNPIKYKLLIFFIFIIPYTKTLCMPNKINTVDVNNAKSIENEAHILFMEEWQQLNSNFDSADGIYKYKTDPAWKIYKHKISEIEKENISSLKYIKKFKTEIPKLYNSKKEYIINKKNKDISYAYEEYSAVIEEQRKILHESQDDAFSYFEFAIRKILTERKSFFRGITPKKYLRSHYPRFRRKLEDRGILKNPYISYKKAKKQQRKIYGIPRTYEVKD